MESPFGNAFGMGTVDNSGPPRRIVANGYLRYDNGNGGNLSQFGHPTDSRNP